MELIFIAGGVFLVLLLLLAQSLSKGVGTVGGALKQVGLFVLQKNPPGLVDIFDDKDGSGSRTWMNFGMLWLVFATLLGFLLGWHTYDPTALDSLASVGWSYDDGSSLREATLNFLTIALLYGLVGSGMVATARNGSGRMASEANASMVALLLTAVLLATYILPFIFGFLDVDTSENPIRTILYSLETLAVGLLLVPVFINLLITAANRGDQELQTSVWFLLMGIAAYIISMLYMFFGELAGATQMVWFAERVAHGWVPLALMFSVGYHVVPMVAKQPIWSGSLRGASMFLLFITIPPFFMTDASASNFVTNLGAILLTLGVLPIFAASINLLMTASSGLSSVVKEPGAIAATMAFLALPFFAIGGYFTAMDTFVGTGELGTMADIVDMNMLFTVGGLLVLAGVFTNYPNAIGKPLATPSTATLATWMVLIGGVTSTLTYLTGEFTFNAVATSEVEDVVANNGGFYLTGAALFYLASIGTILSTMVVIRTGIASTGRAIAVTDASDVASYTLTSGSSTTIRDLIGRGVGVDTVLVVSETEVNEGGSTVIAVDSALHNDEIKEFPTTVSSVMVEFVQYLTNTHQSVFELFRSMDLDDSGKIDSREFLAALEATEVEALSSMEAAELVESMDLDGDGELNLPELDIAIAQIKRDHDIVAAEEEE
ncbi:MAG: EF-hand domain-containing protein [Candidatus Thermoplasmatota archaeon]|nr:EF-hand domain-containing protein [Candidatus Thermoplasmatota archaeon]MEC7636028.1 EF-hand domain-containing protein [Candidatus Thermoplasmatota archaeon]MEE3084026.1 EF-hand domain-containing protein [Candidatus Thermoplasmatota archaeon]